jgi:hypothetical protein
MKLYLSIKCNEESGIKPYNKLKITFIVLLYKRNHIFVVLVKDEDGLVSIVMLSKSDKHW